MKQWSYLNTAAQILQDYSGEQPFASFLKKYFGLHKKHGSRDRKQIAHLCYCYFRLGKAIRDRPVEERILLGLFFCSTQPNEVLEKLRPEWNESTGLDDAEKQRAAGVEFLFDEMMPWAGRMSDTLDTASYCRSFFIQPDLFIRLRPGKEQNVIGKLEKAGLSFRSVSATCLALPINTRIGEVLALDAEVVVQDHNSQRVGEFFPVMSPDASAWDCCAASGGKSIMLHDRYPQVDLWVSDIRESIIANLRKRFREAGITRYKSFVADLSRSGVSQRMPPTDLVIADLPCTGSGTWGRTPEQLFYFEERKIGEYADLQKKIIAQALAFLKPGGHLLYITCSVFSQENEDVVAFMRERFPLNLIRQELLQGYRIKADTLFAALLQKPL